MLGLYEDALVQYDELDALFTQFVLNSHISNGPAWLASFQRPLQAWKGIRLSPSANQQERDLIATCEASLLEFRSYLFQRQCAMLLLTLKPWEVRMINDFWLMILFEKFWSVVCRYVGNFISFLIVYNSIYMLEQSVEEIYRNMEKCNQRTWCSITKFKIFF